MNMKQKSLTEKEKRKYVKLLSRIQKSKMMKDFIDFIFDLANDDVKALTVSFRFEFENEGVHHG